MPRPAALVQPYPGPFAGAILYIGSFTCIAGGAIAGFARGTSQNGIDGEFGPTAGETNAVTSGRRRFVDTTVACRGCRVDKILIHGAIMSQSSHSFFKTACAVTVLMSLAACAEKPKPVVMTPPAPSGTQAPQSPQSSGPVNAQRLPGIQPGSQQDFVVNVGDRIYFDTDHSDIRP